MDRSLAAFIDLPDEPTIDVVDRTTLGCVADCPAMFANLRRGRVNDNSLIAAAGEEVHKAFGAAVNYYLESGGHADVPDIANEMEAVLRSSRPDVQPAAIASAKYSCYAWARHLAKLHADNILRYDGGEGERSGQLSWDIESLALRVTSELDFLAASKSPEVLDEIDFKSGWKQYGIDDVADSFQFQTHAWLVLNNYPDIQALSVRIWGRGGAGHPVLFPRRLLRQYETRIRTAAGYYVQYRDCEPQGAPIWPAQEKCPRCPAAALCPASGLPVQALAANPASFVRELFALEAKAKAMSDAAYQHVLATGQDIDAGDGVWFGRDKPRKETKANFGLYSLKPQEANGAKD